MALPSDTLTQQSEHAYWRRIREERGDEELLSIYGEAFPEESQFYKDIRLKHGPTNAADVLLGTLVGPGEVFPEKGPVSPAVPGPTEVPSAEPAIVPEEPPVAEAVTKPTAIEPSITESDVTESATAAVSLLPIDRPPLPRILRLRELGEAGFAAVGPGLEALGKRLREPAVREFRAMLPDSNEVRRLIDDDRWDNIVKLAGGGILPSPVELGEHFLTGQNLRIARLPETSRRAAVRLMQKTIYNPKSSRQRERLFAGEFPEFRLLTPEVMAEHPVEAIALMVAKGLLPVESLAYATTHPKTWPRMAAVYAAGHFIAVPLGSRAWRAAQANPILCMQVKDLPKTFNAWINRSFKRVGPTIPPMKEVALVPGTDVTFEQIRAFKSGTVNARTVGLTPEMVDAMKSMSGEQIAKLARQAKATKKPVQLITIPPTSPAVNAKASAEITAEALLERQAMGATGRRISQASPSAAGVTRPSAQVSPAEFGVQENLPIVSEGIPTRAGRIPLTDISGAGVPLLAAEPLALPEAGREILPPAIEAMRRPPVEPAPEPTALLPFVDRFPIGTVIEFDQVGLSTVFGEQARRTGTVTGHRKDPTTGDVVAEIDGGIRALDFATDLDNIRTIETAAIVPAVPTEIKPVTVLEEGKTAPPEPPKKVAPAKRTKLSILPDRDRVVAELDAAIKTAPDVQVEYPEGTKFETKEGQRIADKPPVTEKITVKMDGGTIQVFNTKTALTNVRKLVSKIPKTMIQEQPQVRITRPRPIAANKERLDELVKGAPKGYFTDGKVIVKGTPPKTAGFEPSGREMKPELALDMLNRRTDPAELQYYISISNSDMGVSATPITNLDPNKTGTPRAIFKSGSKYAAFDQYRMNMIRKRYPDATYGMTEDGLLIAYDDTEPVAALMTYKLEPEAMMDYPPGLAEAAQAGIVELPDTPPLAGEVSPIVEAHTDKERLTQLLQQRGTSDVLPDDELARSIGRVVDKEEEMANLVKLHGADAVLDEIESQVRQPEPPTTPLDDWRKTEAADLNDRLETEGEAGAIFPRRADEPPLAEDPDLRAAFDNGKKKSGQIKAMALWTKDKLTVVKDFATVEFEPALRRAGHIQFVDDVRTGYVPILVRAQQQFLTDYGIILGTMTNKEKTSWLELLRLRDMENDLSLGLPLEENLHEKMVDMPDGTQIPAVTVERIKLERRLAQSNPEVLAAAERYREYANLTGRDMVMREKLQPESIRKDYFPAYHEDFLKDWWVYAPFAQKVAQEPFRKYTMQRRGSIRKRVYDERALHVHYTSVIADNMMEDWSKGQLEKWDLLDKLSPEQRKIVLNQYKSPDQPQAKTAKHKYPYEYNGKKYMGFSFARTTARWGYEANLKLIEDALYDAALDVDRVLNLDRAIDLNKLLESGADFSIEDVIRRTPEEYEAKMRQFLGRYLEDVGPRGGNAIRKALILGRYGKTYVVPVEIGEKLLKMRDSYGTSWLRPLTTTTTAWKALTLSPVGAGLPFVINQAIGDGLNTFLTSPGAIFSIPEAVRILLNIDPTKEGNAVKWFPNMLGNLTPAEQEARRIVLEKDVLGSGYFREFTLVDRLFEDTVSGRAAKDILKLWTRGNNFREAVLRVAMAYHQSQRVAKGRGLHAPQYKDILPSLDTESGIGHISRNSNVDYLAVPEYYQKFIRGLGFPFATFWQKSATNWVKYIKNAPYRFTGRFVVPYVAADTYNHIMFSDLEAMAPEWFTGRFHIWLGRYDDDGDGFKERARGWGPQQPLDMAIQWTGLHLLSANVAKLRVGIYLTTKEAAIAQLRDMGIIPSLEASAVKQAEQLLNPMIQIVAGIPRNQDSFTRRKIVPEQLSGIPAEEKLFSYYLPYAMEKLATPIGTYMRETRGDEKIFGPIPRREDLGSGLKRFLWNGPINPKRGFGIYDFDVRDLFLRNVITNPVFESKAIGDEHTYNIQKDYITFGGTVSEYLASDRKTKLVEKAHKDGIFFISDDLPNENEYLGNMLNLYWVQEARFGQLEQRATTDEERQQYKNALFQVSYQRALATVDGVPRKNWPAWAVRLINLGKKHPWAQPKETK